MLLQPASHLQTRRKFDPRQISGLGLWLDASDASTITIATGVSAWNDKSGNGRNFAQATGANQPARISAGQNGRNTVRGDGINDYMTMSSGFNLLRNVAGATLVAVRKWVTSPSTSLTMLNISIGGSVSPARAALSGAVATANKASLGGRRTDVDIFASAESAASVAAGFEIHLGLFDYANSDVYQYINGSLDGSNTTFQTNGNTSDTDSAGVGLFANAGGFSLSHTEIGEMLVYPKALAVTDRQAVEGYLAHKWGIASSLPSTHPYRYAAP